VAKVVECLPSKYKALNSNPTATKKEKKKRKDTNKESLRANHIVVDNFNVFTREPVSRT
jgi:hypothetical protein